MSRSPSPETTIFLYILGVALLITSAVILLKGLGILGQIPDYVIWALVLLTLGIGIIGGLRNLRR